MDFPGECLTGTRILPGFGDIAYAVCVAAKPVADTAQQTRTTDLDQPRLRTIMRLRTAEYELRNASIFVSLDALKCELFTFHRRSDLMTDAKAIYGRLSTTLKANTCIISYKSTTSATALLNSDNTRLYQLFMTALVLSVRSVLVRDDRFIPWSASSFLHLDERGSDTLASGLGFSGSSTYSSYGIDLQLLKDGQVLIVSKVKALPLLNRLSKFTVKNPDFGNLIAEYDRPFSLAPLGQLARYNGGRWGKLPLSGNPSTRFQDDTDKHAEDNVERNLQEVWKEKVEAWLIQEGVRLDTPNEELWIEIEIPFAPADDKAVSKEDPPVQSIVWNCLFWPSSLCFLDRPAPKVETSPSILAVTENDDPLQFVEDWFTGAKARAARIAEKNAAREAERARREQAAEEDSAQYGPHIDDLPGLPRVTSREMHAAISIYPTPPDGPLSQVTPGVSSFDGIATTPLDGPRQIIEAGPSSIDHGMQDAGVEASHNNAAVGSGLYDEDLFEDMPEDKFGASGIADEPNWDDFFSEHDFDTMNNGLSEGVDAEEELVQKESENVREDSAEPNVGDIVRNSASSDAANLVAYPIVDGATVQNTLEKQAVSLSSSPKQPNPIEPASPLLSPVDLRRTFTHIPWTSMIPSETEGRERHDDNPPPQDNGRRQSFFGLKPLIADVGEYDGRYSANGRFWFGHESNPISETPLTQAAPKIPVISIPKSGSNNGKALTPGNDSSQGIMPSGDLPRSVSTPEEESDFDSSELFSGDEKPASPLVGQKRKWSEYQPLSPTIEEPGLSPEAEHILQEDFDQLLELLRPGPDEMPLAVLASKSAHAANRVAARNSMIVAQLLVEQVSKSSLQHVVDELVPDIAADSAQIDLLSKLEDVYGRADNMSLQQLVHISEDSSTTESTPRIMRLDTSQVRMQRSDRKLEALPSVLPFWDSLGLQPVGGHKDIMAFCVHPAGRNVRSGCVNFLERLGETYSSCNLGDHTIGNLWGPNDEGFIPWSESDPALPNLVQACERLANILARFPTTTRTIMVYMINPDPVKGFLLDLCEAFYQLFSMYVKSCGKRQPLEVALQTVPVSFVALPNTLAVPTQAEYLSLSLEVYSRCPPGKVDEEIALSGFPVVLAEPAPKDVNFSLSVETVFPMSKCCKCLHVAYSKSPDDRWITACWTDTLGYVALTMCYCVRERGSKAVRPDAEIIKDIWDVSLDIMRKNQGKWQFVVATDAPVKPAELNSWSVLVNEQSTGMKSFNRSMTLVSFDITPPISLRLPPPQQKQTISNTSQQPTGTYGTPASTPQTTMTSPEQLTAATPTPGGNMTAMNAPTPPDHNFDPNGETDVTLADPTDESWAVVLSHGLNNSRSMLDARPALISGYLLKRKGPSDMDNVAAFGVNLLYVGGTPGTGYRDLLREILGQYRGLVTLAKARGVIDPVRSVLPWHVAVAEKGVRILDEVF